MLNQKYIRCAIISMFVVQAASALDTKKEEVQFAADVLKTMASSAEQVVKIKQESDEKKADKLVEFFEGVVRSTQDGTPAREFDNEYKIAADHALTICRMHRELLAKLGKSHLENRCEDQVQAVADLFIKLKNEHYKNSLAAKPAQATEKVLAPEVSTK